MCVSVCVCVCVSVCARNPHTDCGLVGAKQVDVHGKQTANAQHKHSSDEAHGSNVWAHSRGQAALEVQHKVARARRCYKEQEQHGVRQELEKELVVVEPNTVGHPLCTHQKKNPPNKRE